MQVTKRERKMTAHAAIAVLALGAPFAVVWIYARLCEVYSQFVKPLSTESGYDEVFLMGLTAFSSISVGAALARLADEFVND